MSTPYPVIQVETIAAPGRGHARARTLLQARWAAARVLFIGYAGFALISVVGGVLTAPLATHLMLGDWRFWRHWPRAWRLLLQGWRMSGLMLKGEGGFMLDVPLTAPPRSAPDRRIAELNGAWEHGSSCGPCSRCCTKIQCPVLDQDTGYCSGYDAFFWRYFNCGRFPSKRSEIDYYACPKWVMRPTSVRVTLEPPRRF